MHKISEESNYQEPLNTLFYQNSKCDKMSEKIWYNREKEWNFEEIVKPIKESLSSSFNVPLDISSARGTKIIRSGNSYYIEVMHGNKPFAYVIFSPLWGNEQPEFDTPKLVLIYETLRPKLLKKSQEKLSKLANSLERSLEESGFKIDEVQFNLKPTTLGEAFLELKKNKRVDNIFDNNIFIDLQSKRSTTNLLNEFKEAIR